MPARWMLWAGFSSLVATASFGQDVPRMVFLYHADARFLEGLRRHDLLFDYGLRLHNTGLTAGPFGPRWVDDPLLEAARASNLTYYIDRISGGMPFQSLDGIEQVADTLKDDPRFLGFQVHEWGNAPIHDYLRIRKLLIDANLPFDRPHFAEYEGRIKPPFFGGGDFSIYEPIYRPLHTLSEVDAFLLAYYQQMARRTRGEVMGVNGYIQLYHAGLSAGAKNVMAEIGNQVPLTALQIAFARGAAREHGKPFGVYYEPWGGKPFGCPCAVGFSPWFPESSLKRDEWKTFEPNIGEGFGSSRSLQRRLLWYAWLAGASFVAEEWGAENYFANWEDYPLTDYGRVVRDFRRAVRDWPRPEPIVPAALVLPSTTVGVDLQYVAGKRAKPHDLVEPDRFHLHLQRFAADVLASRKSPTDRDEQNLTPSPWIGCFDVLSADAPPELQQEYPLLIRFEDNAASSPDKDAQASLVYQGTKADSLHCTMLIDRLLSLHVQGQVGTARAHSNGRHLLGIFNNLGVVKTKDKEVIEQAATRNVVISGPIAGATYLAGNAFEVGRDTTTIRLRIPGGEISVLSFPDGPHLRH